MSEGEDARQTRPALPPSSVPLSTTTLLEPNRGLRLDDQSLLRHARESSHLLHTLADSEAIGGEAVVHSVDPANFASSWSHGSSHRLEHAFNHEQVVYSALYAGPRASHKEASQRESSSINGANNSERSSEGFFCLLDRSNSDHGANRHASFESSGQNDEAAKNNCLCAYEWVSEKRVLLGDDRSRTGRFCSVVRRLGKGGAGEVFEVELDQKEGEEEPTTTTTPRAEKKTTFALKLVQAKDKRQHTMFLKELAALRQLQGHPHVIGLLAAFASSNGSSSGEASSSSKSSSASTSLPKPLDTKVVQNASTSYRLAFLMEQGHGDLSNWLTFTLEKRLKELQRCYSLHYGRRMQAKLERKRAELGDGFGNDGRCYDVENSIDAGEEKAIKEVGDRLLAAGVDRWDWREGGGGSQEEYWTLQGGQMKYS